jgi:S1-C subfamily serine protease
MMRTKMSWDSPTNSAAYRPRRTNSDLGALAVAILIGGIIGAGVLWFFAPTAGLNKAPRHDPDAQPREVVPRSPFDAEEQEAINLFKSTKDAVVNVDTVRFVRRLDMRVEPLAAGTGSGFIWDEDGRIVTNFHVIQSAIANRLAIRVVLSDRTAWDARVVGVAPDYDLAVLQIAAPRDKLHTIRVGSSHDLEVGQKAYAIGNPFGLSLTLTKGIVSALDREIESPGEQPIAGVIQVDAPINPGNSGGPLLDKDGRLIGVNTAIATPSGGNVGIGFAIPVDTVNTVVPELIRTGRLYKPDLGVRLVDERLLRRAGFREGVMIQDVLPNGPAAKARLRGVTIDPQTGDVEPGDIILAINDEPVRGNVDFARILRGLKVGEPALLLIERGDKRFEVEVVVRGV